MDTIYDLNFEGIMSTNTTKRLPFPNTNWGHNNLLYTRLSNSFENAIKERYASLRETTLSTVNIIFRYEEFMRSQTKELITEDYASTTAGGAYTEIPSKTTNNLQ